MAALGHTSAPFCFVIHQFLGFFPGQVHLSEVSFDDIYSVLPWSSWLSLVTSSSHRVAWRAVLELSILKTCPSHLSLLSLIISSSFLEPVFFLMSLFLILSLHVIPNSLLWNLSNTIVYFSITKKTRKNMPIAWPAGRCDWLHRREDYISFSHEDTCNWATSLPPPLLSRYPAKPTQTDEKPNKKPSCRINSASL